MDIQELNRICRGTLMEHLQIEFTGYGDHWVEATMQITPHHHQPMGVVHGGALLALAETVGSAGSLLKVDPENTRVFGSSVTGQHLSPAKEGVLKARASLLVEADFKHIWDVEIRDEQGKLISISRVTNSVKPKTL